MKLRNAVPDDALEIANIHTYSWLEAYQGVVPTQFLAERPLHLKERVRHWERTLKDPEGICQVAEHNELGVVGFISGKRAEDNAHQDAIQVGYFYLFQKFHGQKIGFRLLKNFFAAAKEQGYKQGYVWVFDSSDITRFYHRAGGVETGEKRQTPLGGEDVQETCFLWKNLDLEQVAPQAS